MLVGLVVLVLPRGAAADTAVARDGNQTGFVAAVPVWPHIFLPIAALLQLCVSRRTPPVALNAQARLAQGHFFGVVFSGQWGGHSDDIVAVAP